MTGLESASSWIKFHDGTKWITLYAGIKPEGLINSRSFRKATVSFFSKQQIQEILALYFLYQIKNVVQLYQNSFRFKKYEFRRRFYWPRLVHRSSNLSFWKIVFLLVSPCMHSSLKMFPISKQILIYFSKHLLCSLFEYFNFGANI